MKNFSVLKGWNWNCCYWPDPGTPGHDIEKQYFNGTTYILEQSFWTLPHFVFEWFCSKERMKKLKKKKRRKSNCRGHDHYSFRFTYSPFDMKMPLNPVICINYRMKFVSKRFPFSPRGIRTKNDTTIRYKHFHIHQRRKRNVIWRFSRRLVVLRMATTNCSFRETSFAFILVYRFFCSHNTHNAQWSYLSCLNLLIFLLLHWNVFDTQFNGPVD